MDEEGSYEKKALLVVSDGRDNHSKYKLKEVVEVLRESKIILYSVGLLSPYDAGPSFLFDDSGKKALKQLAEVTGGASFFPNSVNDVEKICQGIARDLRSQYTIGYRPSNEKLDGSWRKVQVRLNLPKNAPKASVRTKQGYYAPRRLENAGEIHGGDKNRKDSSPVRNVEVR
jgi:Ca-activated chloride channel family protein